MTSNRTSMFFFINERSIKIHRNMVLYIVECWTYGRSINIDFRFLRICVSLEALIRH